MRLGTQAVGGVVMRSEGWTGSLRLAKSVDLFSVSREGRGELTAEGRDSLIFLVKGWAQLVLEARLKGQGGGREATGRLLWGSGVRPWSWPGKVVVEAVRCGWIQDIF